jgi:hypothetical protein
MRLEADYAVPLYLALDRKIIGNTLASFEPFGANDNTAHYLKTWLLYCCRVVQDPFDQDIKDINDRIAAHLGNPKLPIIPLFSYHDSTVARPMATKMLERICFSPITSEYQKPEIGAYVIFNGTLAVIKNEWLAVARQSMINELVKGLSSD